MSKPRKPRLEELIREEVAFILLHEVKDPRLNMITVSRVQASKDLTHALIFVSSLSKHSEEETLDALDHAKGFIRSTLGSRISLRYTPELKFIYDRNYEHASRIDELLAQLHSKAGAPTTAVEESENPAEKNSPVNNGE